ncbi:MAG: molybdopterin dinucleotide binding domain-containing protein [Caldilineaceae bacterium]
MGRNPARYTIPGRSRAMYPDNIDIAKGEMPFAAQLPAADAHPCAQRQRQVALKSATKTVWMHPTGAQHLEVATGDLVRVDTEIGYFVDKVWITEGIKPGVIAMSHHLGRWRLQDDVGVNPGMSSLVKLHDDGHGRHVLNIIGGRS